MKKGFTLIEILVATGIIAVILGVALVSLGGSKAASRDAKRKADLEQIRSALEMCRADNPSYPNTIYTSNNVTCGTTNYLVGTPKDPLDSSNYSYRLITASEYELCTKLENAGTDSCTNLCGSVACNYKVKNP